MEIPYFINQIGNLSEQTIYLVGGGVRDLLLKCPLTDYDLLCQESALQLAQFLENKGLACIRSIHNEFGTVKICWNSNQKIIDLATTRQEIYISAGVLPKVNYPADIETDLSRRDFSINAIAYNLKTAQFIDPLKGQEDLKKGIIKTLHSKSYWEDPTRIIRAVRFANRFGFKISASDLAQIKTALQDNYLHGLIQKIRGVRVGIELGRLLEQDNWLEGAKLLFEIGGFNLLRSDLNIVFSIPKFCLNSFEARLAWLLQKENYNLNHIINELELKNNIRKQIIYIFSISQNLQLQPTLKLFNEINKLETNYQNLLFSLNENIYNLYLKMQKAYPKTKPSELLKEGFKGSEIMTELERIFLSNLD